MTPPRIGPRELVYQNPFQSIHKVSVAFEDFKKDIFVNSFGQRAGLVLVKGGQVLLVRQYRLLVNGLAWEIPGGKVDSAETPEQAARREALEETCLLCGAVTPLLYFHPGLDTHDNPTFV